MAKIKKTYRLNEDLLIELDKWAEPQGLSQTDAIEAAIRKAIQMTDDVSTDAGTVLDVLANQLAEKDRQIENLQKALDQEQQLHLATKALEAPGAKKSWWQKLWE